MNSEVGARPFNPSREDRPDIGSARSAIPQEWRAMPSVAVSNARAILARIRSGKALTHETDFMADSAAMQSQAPRDVSSDPRRTAARTRSELFPRFAKAGSSLLVRRHKQSLR